MFCDKIKILFIFLIKNMWGHFQCIEFSNLPDLNVSISKCAEAPFFLNMWLNSFVCSIHQM